MKKILLSALIFIFLTNLLLLNVENKPLYADESIIVFPTSSQQYYADVDQS